MSDTPTQQELDAADVHLYEGGEIDVTGVLEPYSTVRFFTGPGRHEFIEVRTTKDGWAEVSAVRPLVIQPTSSNRVLIKIRDAVS